MRAYLPLMLAGMVLLGGACDGRPRVNCENPKAVGELRLYGESGASEMRSLCDANPGVVATSVRVEGTTASHLELSCVCGIDDSLFIRNNSELVDLFGLENVRRIGGGIIIADNPKLQTLAGLPPISSLGKVYGGGAESISIENNDVLQDLTGLPPDLTSVPGNILIRKNDGLIDLAGLPQKLTSATSLVISGSPRLRSLEGLPPALATLTGDLYIGGNHSLSDLAGLPDALESVGGTLQISGNDSLASLDGIPQALALIGGALQIMSNDALRDLTGFPADLEVKTYLEISNNDQLVNLAGLPSGLQLGRDEKTGLSLLINRNDNLVDLSGLPQTLSSLRGTIILRRTRLTSLDGLFDDLRTVDGMLHLDDNDALADLSGVPEGTTLGKDLTGLSLLIEGNDGLQSLAGLPTSMSEFPGGVSIVDNDALKDLSGLSMLKSVAGDLFIGKRYRVNLADPCEWDLAPGGNASIESLAGLSSLESVGGMLVIACHPSLTDLQSFSMLRSIGEDLFLLHNPELTNLGDLGGPGGSLETLGGSYVIRCSSKLEATAAEAVLAKVQGVVSTDFMLNCN